MSTKRSRGRRTQTFDPPPVYHDTRCAAQSISALLSPSLLTPSAPATCSLHSSTKATIFRRRLSRVTFITQWLPVIRIPEQRIIRPVNRDDVVRLRRRHTYTTMPASREANTQLAYQEPFAGLLPPVAIATPGCGRPFILTASLRNTSRTVPTINQHNTHRPVLTYPLRHC